MKLGTSFIICLLFIGHSTIFSQSTSLGIKIGNNGNISLNNKFYSGNYNEIYQFGNGYQGAVELNQSLLNFLILKVEASYVNSNQEIDHSSYLEPYSSNEERTLFYEEITINNSTINLAGSAVIKIGPVKIGAGPELAYLFQSVGRGARFFQADSLNQNVAQPVQYRFFSKRKQVYNLNNPDEEQAYDVNRLFYGMNFNISTMIIKPFSIELKTFHPMNGFIESFVGFENKNVHQKSINAQLSLVYTLPLKLQKNKKFKRQASSRSGNKKRFSSARLKKVEPRN